jgi:hypothetical protein
MIEFGSDYHLCGEDYMELNASYNFWQDKRLYACGRHAFGALIQHNDWKRIWVPAYFCYEVVEYIETLHIEVKLYNDFPGNKNVISNISQLPFEDGDVLLRVNYFGLDRVECKLNISIPIIEDHTLGLNSEWMLKSTADWCIVSLRKSLPIAMGGVLWSPKNHSLPSSIEATAELNELVSKRYEAMKLKADYLNDKFHQKDLFRSLYIETEQQIEFLGLSGLDSKTLYILEQLDLQKWLNVKKTNWQVAFDLLGKYNILHVGEVEHRTPFSIVVKCNSQEERDSLKKHLVQRNIYPAVLWAMPESSDFSEACDFSNKMLSIHCDARYGVNDIKYISEQIANFYDSNL